MAGLWIDRHVGVVEEGADKVDSQVLAWAKADWGAALTAKWNSKAVSTQCQAHRKDLVKIGYSDYPKFNFRHVVLDKHPVGNTHQVR